MADEINFSNEQPPLGTNVTKSLTLMRWFGDFKINFEWYDRAMFFVSQFLLIPISFSRAKPCKLPHGESPCAYASSFLMLIFRRHGK